MPSIITVTEVVRSFSNVIARVHYKHESFNVKKGNHILAKLTPVDSQSVKITALNQLFAQSSRVMLQDIDSFEQDI